MPLPYVFLRRMGHVAKTAANYSAERLTLNNRLLYMLCSPDQI